jgi:hypothetical protein
VAGGGYFDVDPGDEHVRHLSRSASRTDRRREDQAHEPLRLANFAPGNLTSPGRERRPSRRRGSSPTPLPASSDSRSDRRPAKRTSSTRIWAS